LETTLPQFPEDVVLLTSSTKPRPFTINSPDASKTFTVLPDYGKPNFGITKKLAPGIDMEQAIESVTASLKKVGFGVLTSIDIQATLKKKIDEDIQPYVILGACNPKLAHKALSSMPAVGLLLPCNVVVTKDASDGNIVVSAMDPISLFSVIDDPEVAPLAEEVKDLVQSAIDSL
jgi:uncharacterized protein (DUF302 family)